METEGRAYLVGAGPGDPELLTLKAAKVLCAADIVLHDELVSQEVLNLVPSTAKLIHVGKRCGKKRTPQEEINRWLVEYALMGLNVVRLKGGDPFIFGRGGEELEALRQAGVEVEIVPGITAALGAAASIGVPLTHREISSALVFLSGSSKNSGAVGNWPDHLPAHTTVVIYMPGHDFAPLQARLLRSGIPADTPCAVVSGATGNSEHVHTTTVGALANSPPLASPRLVIVGEVVALGERCRVEELSELVFAVESGRSSREDRE